MAMILAKMNVRFRTFAVMMFVVPMWMNFLLRTYAWMTILGKNGVLNGILSFFGLPQVQFLYSEGAVLLGMVYNFLPFMVLPIYTVLTKMDQSLIEAAEDLGGNKKIVFFKSDFSTFSSWNFIRCFHGIYASCKYFCYFKFTLWWPVHAYW